MPHPIESPSKSHAFRALIYLPFKYNEFGEDGGRCRWRNDMGSPYGKLRHRLMNSATRKNTMEAARMIRAGEVRRKLRSELGRNG
jgi:hypothetical protein